MDTRRAPRARKRAGSSTPRLPDFSERTVLDLVGLIYDASMEPSLWPIFLEKFADSVQGTFTGLIHYDVRSRSGSFTSAVRVDPAELPKYNEYYIAKDDWANATVKLSLAQGRVFLGQELCREEDFARGEFCNDYLQPMNVFHEIGSIVLKGGPLLSVFTCVRPKAVGAFGEGETRLLTRLVPHLQRALQIHRKIVGLESRSQAAADALDRLPVGVILVDSEGKVLLANRAATKIVNQRDGLSISREGLTAGRSNEHAALQQLIHGASATSKGNGVHPGGMMLVSRPSLRRPFSFIVAPRPSHGFGLGPAHSAAIIFVTDPESELELDHAVLSRLFGLTPAEARMAGAIMQGRSLEATADELSITHETARTHLKHIFDKTSTHRQGELVRLLLTAVPQVRLR